MSEMTWEQKLTAIKSVAPSAHVNMRKPGDWFVDASMMVGKEGSGTCIGEYGNGESPAEAVDDHWRIVLEVQAPRYWIVGVGESKRRVRWNGFMWADVA